MVSALASLAVLSFIWLFKERAVYTDCSFPFSRGFFWSFSLMVNLLKKSGQYLNYVFYVVLHSEMTSWVYACMQFLFLCHVVLLMFPSCLDRNCLSKVWLKWGCSNGCVTMGCLGLPHSHTSEHSQVIWININAYYLIFKPGWLGMFLYTLAITHLSQYKWSRHKYFCNITGFLYEVVGLWLIAMDVSSLRRTRAQISCNFHSLFSC